MLSVQKTQDKKEIIDQVSTILNTINKNFKKIQLDEIGCLNTIATHLERLIFLLKSKSHLKEISADTKLMDEYDQCLYPIMDHIHSNYTESEIRLMDCEKLHYIIQVLDLLIQLPPSKITIDYHLLRARIYFFAWFEDVEKSLKDLNYAIKKANTSWPRRRYDTYYMRANFYKNTHDYDKALSDLKIVCSFPVEDNDYFTAAQTEYTYLKKKMAELKTIPLIDFLKESRNSLQKNEVLSAIQNFSFFLYGVEKYKPQLSDPKFKKELDAAKKDFKKYTKVLLDQLKIENDESKNSE